MQIISKIINNKWSPYIVIIIVWALTILPSAIDSNWFFLDDPTSVAAGLGAILNYNVFTPTSMFGRYTPLYYYYRGYLFRTFGSIPAPAYLIQALTILISLFLIYWIVKALTKSKLAGLLASFIFITGSGIAENAYTIGKQEPLMLFGMLVATAGTIALYKKHHSLIIKLLLFLTIIAFILVAVWNKEPGILIVFLGMGFIALSIIKHKNYLFPGVAVIIGVFLSRLPHLIVMPQTLNSDYTSFSISWGGIVTNAKEYFQQNPDVIVLIALSGILKNRKY